MNLKPGKLDESVRATLRKQRVSMSITRAEAEIIYAWWDWTQDIGDAPDEAETKLAARLKAFVKSQETPAR